MPTRKPVVTGVVFTLTREDGPLVDPDLVVEDLLDNLPDDLWIDDTHYSITTELAPLTIDEGTRHVDV